MRTSGDSPIVVVAIGGFDPGAGAGLGRDLLTASALGAALRMVGTAWTEQGAGGVRSVEPRAPDALEDAVRWALREPTPGAVKVGMVPGPDAADAILRGLADFAGAVVVDPVLAASNGGALWQGPIERLRALLRRATLVTPNAPEASALAGHPVHTPADAAAVASQLCASGIAAVLLKGGHLDGGGAVVTDLLATAEGQRSYERPRAPGPSPRGTGCALATAIAIALASGRSLDVAIGEATTWLADRINRAVELHDGERRLG